MEYRLTKEVVEQISRALNAPGVSRLELRTGGGGKVEIFSVKSKRITPADNSTKE